MKRRYTLKSNNPILDGTETTIYGKGLAEIKIKLDRILEKSVWLSAIPLTKREVAP